MTPAAWLLLACAGRRAAVDRAPSAADWALAGQDDCAAWDSPRLARRLDRRTGSVERAGNRAELLVDGVASFARRLERAREADVILVKTFIFTGDEVGREIAELLSQRAREGAVVIVQYDIKGSIEGLPELLGMLDLSPDSVWLGDKPLLAEMAAAGVVVVPTNVPRRARSRGLEELASEQTTALQWLTNIQNLDHYDHEKYWITGRFEEGGLTYEAILGGMNIASEYAYGGTDRVDPETGRGGWRDTDVALAGPVVDDILERYFDVLEHNLGDPLPAGVRARLTPPQPEAGGARARFVWNQPALGNKRHIERLYRALVDATPEGGVVRLASAYFAPGWRVHRKLEGHLDEGRLAVITNSPESIDVPLVTDAARARYRQLLRASPEAALFEWRARPDLGHQTLHSKVASFGDCGPALVGSANLDGLSSEHNSESVVVILDPDFRRDFDAMFEADLAPGAVSRVTAEKIERTPALKRAWQAVVLALGWRYLGL